MFYLCGTLELVNLGCIIIALAALTFSFKISAVKNDKVMGDSGGLG